MYTNQKHWEYTKNIIDDALPNYHRFTITDNEIFIDNKCIYHEIGDHSELNCLSFYDKNQKSDRLLEHYKNFMISVSIDKNSKFTWIKHSGNSTEQLTEEQDMTCKKIDLRGISVGDEVYSILNDWGSVSECHNTHIYVDYPNISFRVSYDYDGKRNPHDLYPEIQKVLRKTWDPKKRNFVISTNGDIYPCFHIESNHHDQCAKEGRSYETKDMAKKAHAMIRKYQRLIAWILEHDPENDFEKGNHVVAYDFEDDSFHKGELDIRDDKDIGAPRISSKQVAKKLADDLNSGRLTL
jgi:hypothetical protein